MFKFYAGECYYAFSGNTEEEAREALIGELPYEVQIDNTEEIPESEWDEIHKRRETISIVFISKREIKLLLLKILNFLRIKISEKMPSTTDWID